MKDVKLNPKEFGKRASDKNYVIHDPDCNVILDIMPREDDKFDLADPSTGNVIITVDKIKAFYKDIPVMFTNKMKTVPTGSYEISGILHTDGKEEPLEKTTVLLSKVKPETNAENLNEVNLGTDTTCFSCDEENPNPVLVLEA